MLTVRSCAWPPATWRIVNNALFQPCMNPNDPSNSMNPIIRYLDETQSLSCPYGDVRRVVTGGEGGVANVHVVRVIRGNRHFHTGYNEVYYILSGSGIVIIGENSHAIRPGAVVVIPAGVSHSLQSDTDMPLEFVIFGTPPISLDDARAMPMKDFG